MAALDEGTPLTLIVEAVFARSLSANLLQAQRDYFGAHTYERIDRPRGEFYHTRWNDGI